MNIKLNSHPKKYFERLDQAKEKLDCKKIVKLILKIKKMIGTKGTIFIAGNGGSAALSSHMACDLGKTILGNKPRLNNNRLRVISLVDNVSLITAWANDEGYKYIFSEQLKSLAKKGDFLIVISASGNSENIVELVEIAKKMDLETFGVLGFNGGKVRKIVDDYILAESNDYGVIEDLHTIIVHLITDWFKYEEQINNK